MTSISLAEGRAAIPESVDEYRPDSSVGGDVFTESHREELAIA